MNCSHVRRQMFRVLISDGRSQATERCLDCGCNPRPNQLWVPHSELKRPVEELPLLGSAPAPKPERSLFDGTD